MINRIIFLFCGSIVFYLAGMACSSGGLKDKQADKNQNHGTNLKNIEVCLSGNNLSPEQYDSVYKRINAKQKTEFLDKIFRKKVKRDHFNGNVLIAQEGIILYKKAFGNAMFDKKNNIELTLDSEFQLASVSKTFTAAAILKLGEENCLNLDDSLQVWFPKFPYPGISLRMLLTHRSGLPNYTYAFGDSSRKVKTYPDGKTILQWFESSVPKAQSNPNQGFSYNNTNYVMLALVVEKVSGMSFPDYLKNVFFKPLGMTRTFLKGQEISSEHLANQTFGYEGRRFIRKDFFDDVYGDKGVYSTVGDLYKWYKALTSECLLRKETLDLAFVPNSFEHKGIKNYGYGFRLMLKGYTDKEVEYIYHTGWWKGYNSIFWFSPEYNFVIIILGNRRNATVYRIKDIINILENYKNPSRNFPEGM